MTDKILTTSLESANSALELANIAIEKLKAELDDHCQQLRKEQLAVQSLHEKLAEQTGLVETTWEQLEHRQRINDDLLAKLEELAHDLKNAAEWKGAFVTLKDRMAELELQEPVGYVYMHNGMAQGALTDKAMKAGTPLYKRGTP